MVDLYKFLLLLICQSAFFLLSFTAISVVFVFSAPEPKAQVHYCDHALSVVRPSVRRR